MERFHKISFGLILSHSEVFLWNSVQTEKQRHLSECQRWKNNSMNLHLQINKLAKLKRHASHVHFASNIFGCPIHFVLKHFRLYTLGFEHVSRHVQLLVGHHVCHPIQLHVGQSFFSAAMSATLSTSMLVTISATTMSSRSFVRSQKRIYLRTDRGRF